MNSGKIVMHRKSGRIGRTYDINEPINGKISVYFEIEDGGVFGNKATLCNPNNLEIIGFID
jgi:hypothetical protein